MIKKENIFYYLCILFFISFYLPWQFVSASISGLLVISALTLSTFQEKWEALKNRKYVWGMIIFFLIIILSIILSENINRGLRYLNTRLPLIIFPLSIGLLNLSKEFKDKILFGFALITTLTATVCIGSSFYNFFTLHRTDVFYNDYLTLIIGQQSVYIALLVNFAIYIFAYFLFFKQGRQPYILILSSLFSLFIFSYFLASRINLIVLGFVSLGFIFYYILKNQKILEGFTLLFGLILGAFLIQKFQPTTMNRFKELSFLNFKYENKTEESHFGKEITAEQWNGANFRLAAWQCGWELFKSNPILGVGLGDKRDELNKKFEEKSFLYAIQTKKNVHNNYLDILYSMGSVGFLAVIISCIFMPIWQLIQIRDFLALLFITSLLIAWFAEVYFDRSLGGMVVGFFLAFMPVNPKEKRQP